MTQLTSRAIPVVLVLSMAVFSLVMGAATGEAQATRSFKDGREAVEAGRWAEGEALLRAAIAEDPEARRKGFTRYTPYYYLGVALDEQGNCPAALEAFRSSERYGALKEDAEERDDMARRKGRCQQMLAEIKAGVEAVDLAIHSAEEAKASLERLARNELLVARWQDGSPSFASRQTQAREWLANALSKRQSGKDRRDVRELEEAVSLAEQARSQFEAVRTDARQTLGEVSETVTAAMSELDKAEGSARSLLRSVRSLAPHPEQLAAQVQALQRALAKVDKERDDANAAETEQLTSDLVAATNALRPLAAGPPRTLLTAANAYLAQDYAAVIAALEGQNLRGDRAKYHALVLHSAALFGQYVSGGEQDPTLLESCRALIEQSADLGDDLGQPGERFFSPRYRELYAATVESYRDTAGQVDPESDSSADTSSGR